MRNIHEKAYLANERVSGPQKHEIRICREKVFQVPTVSVGEILK